MSHIASLANGRVVDIEYYDVVGVYVIDKEKRRFVLHPWSQVNHIVVTLAEDSLFTDYIPIGVC